MANMRDERVRNWVFLIYPDNCPENWREILASELLVPAILSPLHDKDVNADGTPKKPHYHVLMMFEGNKSYSQIKEISDMFSGVSPKKCISVRGSVRYWCHLDNPEKHQYPESEIQCFCGADKEEALKKTASYRYMILREMYDFVMQQKITEITQLLDYCLSHSKEDWFVMLVDGQAHLIKDVIKSLRHQIKDNEDKAYREVIEGLSKELFAIKSEQLKGKLK